MNVDAMPVIRLTIDSMKQQIAHALGTVGSQYQEHLNQQIEQALLEYPWEKQVKDIVFQELNEHIHSYFRFGHGRQLITDVLDAAFMDKNGGEG